MSTRYEWMHLPSVQYVGPNTDVTTSEPANEDTMEEETVEDGALLLWADECTVVTGEADDLAEWAVTALAEAVTGGGQHLYEKCLVCHLFVEPNDAADEHTPADTIAPYMHLHRGDDEDDALDASHEPHPSGVRLPLAVWKMYGPTAMRARFINKLYGPGESPEKGD